MPAQRGSSSGTTSGGDIEQPSKAHLAASNQLQRLEARVAVLADDDVIVHADAERSGDSDGLADASRDRLAARCGLGHTAAQGTALSRGLKSGPIRF